MSLVHFGTVYSVSRSPYIAMAGLGKASRLSPRLRELLAHLADHATELVDDLLIDRAVFREPTGQGGEASWRHALHGARLLTYPPFFSCVLRRRWGTSYSVGVRGSGMMRHKRRVFPGGRSSFAGDPVEICRWPVGFCREVGRVLPAASRLLLALGGSFTNPGRNRSLGRNAISGSNSQLPAWIGGGSTATG